MPSCIDRKQEKPAITIADLAYAILEDEPPVNGASTQRNYSADRVIKMRT